MKRIGLAFLLGLVLLLTVLLVRTARFTSRQLPSEPAAQLPVDATAAAERLAGSLRFRTISYEDPGQREEEQFAALRDYLQASFPRVHGALGREMVGQGALLYTWPGSDPALRPILLMGHLDVVPVEPGTEAQWTHPPFAGRIADGYIWGRGAMDDKLGVLGVLEAAELLLAQGHQPRRTVYLAFGADEEVGGAEGAARIAALLASRGVELELVLDEGGALTTGTVPGVTAPVAVVGIAEKGSLSIELIATAEGGHSSMPPRQTAVGITSRAIQRLEERPFPGGITGPTREMFDYVGREMGFGPRIVFANLWLFRPLVERQLAASPTTDATLRTTTAATIFQAGVKENVLPSSARAVVNFRLRPGDSAAGVLERVREVVDDPRVELRLLGEGSDPSPVSPTDSPSWTLLQRTIRQVFPDAVVAPYLVVGATDARHFSALSPSIYRFLPLRLGPGETARLHGTDERISVENYAEAVRFYAQLMLNGTQ
jgi:carboxypeptidase PM20D1